MLLEKISAAVWGTPLICAIFSVGIYLTVKLKFIQVRELPSAVRALVKKPEGEGTVSQFHALATSLAAMLGTGNIVGVAAAVSQGGAGAIFWMVIAATFGMAISYAEGYLAVKYRKIAPDGHILGGAFLYMEHGLGKKARPLAIIFAIFCALAALLGMGTMTQSSSIASVFCALYDFKGNALCIAIVVTVLTWVVLSGGIERIASASAIVVPVMGAVYIIGTIGVLIHFADRIPKAISEILNSALNIRALGGAAVGCAVRLGVSRGIFSNEAGLGSASIPAASAKCTSAHEQGLCTMVGTWIDTVLLCTMTGIAIVASGAHHAAGDGGAITMLAYNSAMPRIGGLIVSTSLMLFAFASIIGWSYYGEQCIEYISGKRESKLYRTAYIAAVFAGALISVSSVWAIADILNGLMAVPNLIAIYLLKKRGKLE